MQGFITAPSLFNIYILESVERLSETGIQFIVYADDILAITESQQ